MKPLILLALLPFTVFAGGWHHSHEQVTNVTEVTEVTELTEVTNLTELTQINNTTIESSNTTGVALGIATSQLNFDWGTNDVQVGAGLGNFEDNNAASIGIGKRFKHVLINGSVGREGGKSGYGVGVMTRF